MESKKGSTFVLGLDGGGSHTQCVILNEKGTEVGRGTGGASNHHSVGVEAARGAIVEAIKNALDAAGNPTLSAASWGIAGLDWPEDERIFQEMAQQLLPEVPVRVVHDATIALVGGTDGKQYGLVIISGTGSIAVGYHPSGRMERAGGWGHLVGDEGSGYQIALQGLNAATRAFDGRDQQTSLIEGFVKETSEASLDSLVNEIYLEKWNVPKIAALAPVVFTAAEQGDNVAIRIVERAAHELALAAQIVIENLEMQTDAFDVVLSGGIFIGSNRVVSGIRREIHSFASKANVILPIREPLIGAGMIALQMLSS